MMCEDDKPHEECGVFGVWNAADAAALTALGLHALQHRGQEAAGIVSLDSGAFHTHKGRGLVGDNFSDARVIASLPGRAAIGHNRYATTGETALRNVQPLYADFEFGGLAVAHNGNLTNAIALKRALVRRGCLFQSSTDSEVFVHLIAISLYANVVDRLIDALKQVQGAYSLVALHDGALLGARDPLGVRPLVLGRIGEAFVLASETCALDIVGADFLRDVEPGEIVVINGEGVRSIKPFAAAPSRFCVFEHIYFARPDSVVEGTAVYETRKRIGAELARESGIPADVIVPVPDSGVPAAMGYAAEAGVPFELGIIRNHYVGRTFIEPTDQIRHLGVKLKHSANRAMIEGKRVILVDDSIVRGTTSKKIVEMVRQAGAAEVHMRVSSPPTTHSCFYGIDTPERSQLMAAQHDVPAMARIIGVDSLAFISLDGLYRALGRAGRDAGNPGFCDACFTGDYAIPLTDWPEEARA
jgi:amidophosphoribosyltransferase